VTTQVLRFLISRISMDRIVHIGLAIIFCGSVLMLSMALLFTNNLLGLVVSLMFYMGGLGLIFGPLQRSAIAVSTAPMGTTMAIFFVAMAFAAVLGSALVSVFYQGTIISLAAPMAILGMLGSIFNYCKRFIGEKIVSTIC